MMVFLKLKAFISSNCEVKQSHSNHKKKVVNAQENYYRRTRRARVQIRNHLAKGGAPGEFKYARWLQTIEPKRWPIIHILQPTTLQTKTEQGQVKHTPASTETPDTILFFHLSHSQSLQQLNLVKSSLSKQDNI